MSMIFAVIEIVCASCTKEGPFDSRIPLHAKIKLVMLFIPPYVLYARTGGKFRREICVSTVDLLFVALADLDPTLIELDARTDFGVFG